MNREKTKGNNKKGTAHQQFLKNCFKKGGELITELSAQVL